MVDFTHSNQQFVNSLSEERANTLSVLTTPPLKRLIVVTCMDARLNPAEFLGLGDGDAHVIRNAGGSANDGINSIVVSQRLLGTQNIAVIHHTDCGMATFTPPLLHAKVLAETPGEAAKAELSKLEFRTFTDLDQSVREDVSLLQDHPLVFTTEGSVSGWVYETSTGKVRRVV